VVALKREGDTVAAYPDVGRADQEALDMVQLAAADVLLEASPVNLSEQAEPGLSCVLTALRRGMHVVTPNKGPLVVAYQEVQELAAAQGVELRFDGTVAGGLPALNIGQRDMRGAVIQAVEAVPNLVTGYVMDMLADGVAWDAALARAREEGVLEADSAWDLEGWDAAAKLAILANAVLDEPAQLVDVVRTGITDLDPAMLVTAREQGKRYRLLARAERQVDGGYELSVAPVPLPPTHPLAGLGSKQMGVCYFTDIYGTLTTIIDEPTPVPSAATMLRDLLDIFVV
jgi:homoserine dehydrogenase